LAPVDRAVECSLVRPFDAQRRVIGIADEKQFVHAAAHGKEKSPRRRIGPVTVLGPIRYFRASPAKDEACDPSRRVRENANELQHTQSDLRHRLRRGAPPRLQLPRR
jgi:hypothetical protein